MDINMSGRTKNIYSWNTPVYQYCMYTIIFLRQQKPNFGFAERDRKTQTVCNLFTFTAWAQLWFISSSHITNTSKLCLSLILNFSHLHLSFSHCLSFSTQQASSHHKDELKWLLHTYTHYLFDMYFSNTQCSVAVYLGTVLYTELLKPPYISLYNCVFCLNSYIVINIILLSVC